MNLSIDNADSESTIQGLQRLYRRTGMESNGVGQYWCYAWAPGNQGTLFGGCVWAGLHGKGNQEDHLGTVGDCLVECDRRHEPLERLAEVFVG